MEGGERKEEAALPPDYVSLAQLQERWLQKQEEMKLKQKREEEEKRERDARELKQRQEEEEKRERNARAQNGRNQNHRWGAKIGGGFVRATGVIKEKGKGKEIVLGGLGDGGEDNKKIEKEGGRGQKKRYFKGAAAIEEKAKVGGAEEVLSGRGAGIFSGEGGSGGGSSGVEEIGCVSVVEVLPRNGETADVNRSDLRGGFKKNGRDKGKPRGNELKRSEVAIDLEEEEGEKEGGQKWSGSGRGIGSERGEEGRSERGVDRGRGRGSERGRDRGRVRRRGRGEERWSDRGGEGGSERDVDRGRGSEEEGEREGERGGERGRGSERGGGRARGGERGGERGRGRGRGRGGERGKNGSNPQRKINMLKDYRPAVVEGNEVDLKLENKADLDDISEVCSEIASLRVGDRNEIGGPDNRAKEDGAEGEGSNSDEVTVEIEKKVDHRVLARKGDNGGSWMGYRPIGVRVLDSKAKEDGVEGEGSKGEIVAVGIEKKVYHKVLPRKGENRGYGKGYRENGIQGRENKAKEDGVEGGGSNSDEVAVEIENKVDHKVFRRKGENRGFWRAYPAIRKQGGGFGRGRSYTRHDDFRMKWTESGTVWVKKEDKQDA